MVGIHANNDPEQGMLLFDAFENFEHGLSLLIVYLFGLKVGRDQQIVFSGEDKGCVIVEVQILPVLIHKILSDSPELFLTIQNHRVMIFMVGVLGNEFFLPIYGACFLQAENVDLLM